MLKFRAPVAALTLAALLTTPAFAAWEAPQRIDNSGLTFREFVDGDIGTGANGLTTAFFWQRTQTSGDSGQLYSVRRTADGAWSAPTAAPLAITVTPTFTDAISAPSGSSAAAFTFDTTLRMIDWPAAAGSPGTVFDSGVVAEGDDSSNQNAVNGPDVAVDGAGNIYAVSVRRQAGYRAVVYTYDAGSGTWSGDPVVASGDDDDVYRPRIAANSNGALAVSWASDKGDQGDKVFVSRKLAGEAGFTPKQQVSVQEGGSVDAAITEDVNQHDVVIDADGNVTIAYAQDRARFAPRQGEPQTYDRIYAIRWPAGAVSPDAATRKLISSSDPQAGSTYDPQLVISPLGRISLAWRQLADPVAPPGQTNDQLFIAEYTGAWSGPAQVTAADAPAYDIAVDGAGFLTVAWAEGSVAKARRKAPGEPFEDEEVISLTGAGAGVVKTSFAPHLSDSTGTQTDALFQQTLTATTRDQALAARFTPAAPPGPEPAPAPPLSDCPADNALQAGDEGDNTLTGTDAADTLLGFGGADKLIGLEGVDCLRGGDGDDTAAGGGAGDDVDGGAGNDTLEGNEGNDAVFGGDGDDLLAGQEGIDRLEGGDGDDRVLGGDLNDFILGGAGNDRLFGQNNSDLIGGDEGDDLVNGQDGNDLLAGGPGNDKIIGGDQRDTLLGQDGDDRLNAGRGADKLFGDAGDDRLSGRGGKDELVGGPGSNRLFGGGGGDLLVGDVLDDLLKGGKGRDQIFGADGDDRIAGQRGRDEIDAGDGDDKVRGGKGKDKIDAGDGDDNVNGGKGKDEIDAGAGDDKVKVRDGKKDEVTCGEGTDTVKADPKDEVDFSCEFVKVKRKKRRSRRG